MYFLQVGTILDEERKAILIRKISFIKNKIPFGMHYPAPIHKLKACKKLFENQHFPNAENFAKKTLSLPIDPNLTMKQLQKIINIINDNEI